ncbi:hypothetical protein C8R42DRAFT_732303 [Lentinula raphanica]|nr:hypothetical protein C8R42DRAFT_732303 [Lentinula raphanica]
MELEARVSELEARVSELEMELSQWKRAQSASQIEASERGNVLLQQFSNQDPLVLCVINGQNTFFNRQLLVQGFVGGQSAAHYLTKFISEYLTSEDNQLAGRLSLLSFWISIYFNKSELVELLVNQNICSREQLEGFLAGFCETSPRFIVVEVGIGEGAVDRKIREFIHTCARLPQTVKTFLAGECGFSNALYSGPFSGLKAENLLDKLVILRGDSEEDWSDQTFPIDILSVRELLVQVQHHSSNQQLATSIVQTMGSVLRSSTNGGLVSPRSPPHEGSRYIDPRYV